MQIDSDGDSDCDPDADGGNYVCICSTVPLQMPRLRLGSVVGLRGPRCGEMGGGRFGGLWGAAAAWVGVVWLVTF